MIESETAAVGLNDLPRADPEVETEPGALALGDNPEPIDSDSVTGHEGFAVEQKWKQYFNYSLVFVASVVCVTVTVTYAFLSSSSKLTIFSNPGVSIFVLSFLSIVSAFLLNECVTGACDVLRWNLAVRPSGVGIATFLSLGRATSPTGVLRLLFSKQRVGHRRWCIQRFNLISG